jgi:membrane protein DedA with SNARE-associated domain
MSRLPRFRGGGGALIVMSILAGWIVQLISAGGYAGVAALMAVESACIPLPSEVIMPFAGYVAYTGRFTVWEAAIAGAVGCNIGSTIAYYVGMYGGRAAVQRWGRLILLDVRDLDRAERFFARFGAPAVLLARLLPVVRTFIAFPAGVARMRQLPFQIYTFIGSLVWCYALADIGFRLGANWDRNPLLAETLHRFDLLIAALLLVAIAWFLWHRLRDS